MLQFLVSSVGLHFFVLTEGGVLRNVSEKALIITWGPRFSSCGDRRETEDFSTPLHYMCTRLPKRKQLWRLIELRLLTREWSNWRRKCRWRSVAGCLKQWHKTVLGDKEIFGDLEGGDRIGSAARYRGLRTAEVLIMITTTTTLKWILFVLALGGIYLVKEQLSLVISFNWTVLQTEGLKTACYKS
jgi:hypothetical protein